MRNTVWNHQSRASRSSGRPFARKLYGWSGFDKGYNFVLFFILAGALMGFALARFQYLDIGGIFLKVSMPIAPWS